jgi:CysZ protein
MQFTARRRGLGPTMRRAMTQLAPRPDDRLARAERPGFFGGMSAFFSGFGFVLTTPAVWPLALVPMVVALGLTLGFSGLAMHFLMPWLGGMFAPKWHVLAAILKILAGLLSVMIATVLGFGLAQPLSGPALERIVRRSEAAVGAPAWAATSFKEDVLRSLESVIVSYAFGLPLLALLFVASFFLTPFVTFPLKLIVLAILAAWDLCDYPLSIRGIPVAQRVAFVRRNLSSMLGFGAAIALVSLVPCAILFVLPAGVAGAARLTLALERAEASRR